MLQAHRKNLCELNLPNRVTKIIEVPSSGTVRTAVTNVLKRYSYTLDIMEVKNASTLQVCIEKRESSWCDIVCGRETILIY